MIHETCSTSEVVQAVDLIPEYSSRIEVPQQHRYMCHEIYVVVVYMHNSLHNRLRGLHCLVPCCLIRLGPPCRLIGPDEVDYLFDNVLSQHSGWVSG